jgi:hypothetical protein
LLLVTVFIISLYRYIENISWNGTASQSSTYYWKALDMNMTADLAITGGRTHDFYSRSCATTGYPPPDYLAWWMLTFPVDTVYVTNIRIYYRGNRKFYFQVCHLNLVIFPCSCN